MPWSNNNGPKSSGPRPSGPRGSGPWGGGGGGGNGGGPWGGGGGSGGGRGGQGPNIDDLFKKGQSQLKTVLGEGGGGGGFGVLLALIIAAGAWIYVSVYTVKLDEQAVVLTFGKYTATQGPGLNFAPWPVQTAEIRSVTKENQIVIGSSRSDTPRSSRAGRDEGVMLTGDENIVDVSFNVIWNINELDKFLFNLAEPDATIAAVSEAAMREVVGRSELAPLLNRDRALLQQQVADLVQTTLDEYQSGVNIVRVNLDRVDPPPEVIDAFRDVQAAAQERDTLLKQAQAYFNEKTAGARGEAARLLEDAEAYRAQVVAEAQGQAARFEAVLVEYKNAEDVTRQRLYIETMERVYGGMNKIIIDESADGASGVVPYLPLNELQRNRGATAAANRAE